MKPFGPHLVTLAIIGLGCGNESTSAAPDWASPDEWRTWNECEDAACRETIVRANFQRDPRTAAQWLGQIEVVEEQLALVQILVTEDTARAGQLCAVLENPQARQNCERNTSRPHMYTRPPRSQVEPRTASGPAQATLILPPQPTTRLTSLGADPGSCGEGDEARACLLEAARSLASEGRGEEAAQRCMAIDVDDSWRWDCHFQAAEVLTGVEPIDSYEVIADLCLASGEFAGRCVDKVNSHLAQSAPPSTAPASSWQGIREAADAIEAAWQDPSERERILMGYWSAVLARSYSLADELGGDPIDHLPDAAGPHIRAATAMELIRRSTRQSANLESLVSALETTLDHRVENPGGQAYTPGRSPNIHNYWERDETGDGDIPATIYLGTTRRAVSGDIRTDLRICILEAAAQEGGSWRSLLRSNREHEAPLVAWTANRLWERTAP